MSRGPSRRGLLFGGLAATAGLLLPLRRARAAGDRLLLVYWVDGGWDPSACFDPHFESSALDRDPESEPATIGGIDFAHAASRPEVTSFLEAHGSETVVVNGLAVGSISHPMCSRIMLTGSRADAAADIGTRVSAGGTSRYALPHLVVSGPSFPGSLGAHVTPLSTVLTGTVLGEIPRGSGFDAGREARIRAYLGTEAALHAEARPGPQIEVYREGLDHFATVEGSVESIHLLDFARDEEKMQAAIHALAEGLSRSVTVAGSLPLLSRWDSHTANHMQQGKNFAHLFGELSWLIGRLESLPGPDGTGSLYDLTTVLVLSEMGRTPVLNAASGKDHWPFTSCMLIGPSIRGGRVLGRTNDALVGQPIDLSTGEPSSSGEVLTPAALSAGLLTHLDIDPAEHFPGVTPFTAPFG